MAAMMASQSWLDAPTQAQQMILQRKAEPASNGAGNHGRLQNTGPTVETRIPIEKMRYYGRREIGRRYKRDDFEGHTRRWRYCRIFIGTGDERISGGAPQPRSPWELLLDWDAALNTAWQLYPIWHGALVMSLSIFRRMEHSSPIRRHKFRPIPTHSEQPQRPKV